MNRVNVIIWLTLVFLIVLVAVFADSLSDSVYQEVEEEYAVYQATLAESSAKTLRLFFQEVSAEMRLLAGSDAVRALDHAKAASAMKDLLESHSQFLSNIMIVNTRGEVVGDIKDITVTPRFAAQMRNLWRLVLLSAADRSTRELVDSHPVISRNAILTPDFLGYALAVPVYLPDGEEDPTVGGMLVVLIRMDKLGENVLNPIQLKRGSAAFMVTHDGGYVAPPASRPTVKRLKAQLEESEKGRGILTDMSDGGKRTVWQELGTGEENAPPDEALFSYAPAEFAGVSWSVGILTPREEITRLVSRSRQRSLLMATFISVVLYVGAVVLMRINSGRVKAEEEARHARELEEKNRELEELNRMKDEFVSIVSHDLRSPIGTIYTYAKMMMPQAEKAELSTRPLEAIIRSSDRLLTLVNDILDLARVESGKMTVNYDILEVDQLVQDSFKAIEFNAAQKNIKLDYQVDGGPSTVKADANKLYQVLNNLIGNAIKFSPEESTVAVTRSQEGNDLLMSVKDEGPGLSEEEQKVVFDRFHQTGYHQGSGLGLAICKNMVELHKGRIWVESEPDKGADFRFTIPATPPEEKAVESGGAA